MTTCTNCGSAAAAHCAACVINSFANVLDVDRDAARILAAALLPDLLDYDLPGTDRVRHRLRALLSKPATPQSTFNFS